MKLTITTSGRQQYITLPVGNPGLQGNSAFYAAPENGAVRGSKSSVLWVGSCPEVALWAIAKNSGSAFPNPSQRR
jgi:hypothetical protein